MLLIPIGQEQSTVRRHPWVTYAIIALNLVVLLGLEFAGHANQLEAEVSKTHRELYEHLVRHPYLDVPQSLAARLPPELSAALDHARERAYRRGQVPAPGRLRTEQQQLDDLAAQLEERTAALPSHRLGYVPARRRPLNLVTSVFVHAGWMHLIGNMLFLLLSAPFVEDAYGRALFTVFYLSSGVVASEAHALAHPSSVAALVGASGAIAGVMGAFLVRFGRRRIRFLFIPIPILWRIRTRFLMPAWAVLPFWIGQQILFAHADEDASGTAWWAHIGGFAFGVVVATALRLTRVEERFISPGIERQTTLTAHPSLERIVDARVAGDYDTARRELERALRSQPTSLDAWQEAYELALAQRDPNGVGRAATRLFDLFARAGEHELAADLLHDGRWRDVGPLSPQLGLTAATLLEREGDARAALELLEHVARAHPRDPKTLRALVRRGEIFALAGDRAAALAAFQQARAHPSFGPPWADLVEARIREADPQSRPRPIGIHRGISGLNGPPSGARG
jgi:membrane associated rhomboid family serine protease